MSSPYAHRPYLSLYAPRYALEILNNPSGWAASIGTGSLVANTGQSLVCSRAASAYVTLADGSLRYLGANTIRTEVPGILVEGASINDCLNSQTIGATGWTNYDSIGTTTYTANTTDVLAPDGTHTSTKAVFPANSGSGNYNFTTQQVGTFGGAAHTFSFYGRTASGTVTLYLQDFTNFGSWLACVLTTTWQRFQFTWTASPSNYRTIGWDSRDSTLPTTFAGGTCYLWQGQDELGTFATSPIITTTIPVTRDADIVYVANPLTGSETTFFVQCSFLGLPGSTGWGENIASLIGRYLVVDSSFPGTGSWTQYLSADALAVGMYYDPTGAAQVTYATVDTGPLYDKHIIRGTVNTVSPGEDMFVDSSITKYGTGQLLPAPPRSVGANITLGNRLNGSRPANGWLSNIIVDPSYGP